ncbi:MAG: class I SAM-dependent methyltransferase [bacterium]
MNPKNPINLSFNSVERFINFISNAGIETNVEELSLLHSSITEDVISQVNVQFPPNDYPKILDVGCGSGVALKRFKERGYTPVGITINAAEYEICKNQGYDVFLMDQSFLDFNDENFNIIWARHVIEHSLMPYYTLIEFKRVLKSDGILYIEVPAPDTIFNHQNNPFHFSTLTKSSWKSLIQRAGFVIINILEIPITSFEVEGEDYYWTFLCAKAKL